MAPAGIVGGVSVKRTAADDQIDLSILHRNVGTGQILTETFTTPRMPTPSAMGDGDGDAVSECLENYAALFGGGQQLRDILW